MYFLFRSYYVNMSWGQRTILNALKGFINEETRAKMVFSGDGFTQDMVDMFHPCQLEKRFGGAMDTPTNFWPPYVGTQFTPPGQEPALQPMGEQEY